MLVRSSKKTKVLCHYRGQLISQGMQQFTHTHTHARTLTQFIKMQGRRRKADNQKILSL